MLLGAAQGGHGVHGAQVRRAARHRVGAARGPGDHRGGGGGLLFLRHAASAARHGAGRGLPLEVALLLRRLRPLGYPGYMLGYPVYMLGYPGYTL
eukprot:527193-Prorocentrum_minimum.AAC.3